jgi:hypothetical protein
MKRECAEFTARYLAGEVKLEPMLIELMCTCRSFPKIHTLDKHRFLRSEHDWRIFSDQDVEANLKRQEYYERSRTRRA